MGIKIQKREIRKKKADKKVVSTNNTVNTAVKSNKS